MIRWPNLFAKPTPSPIERAEAEAIAKVNTQAISRVRALKQRATINGLLASVDDQARARFDRAFSNLNEGRGAQ